MCSTVSGRVRRLGETVEVPGASRSSESLLRKGYVQ
jgi:hypothetical protein